MMGKLSETIAQENGPKTGGQQEGMGVTRIQHRAHDFDRAQESRSRDVQII